MTNEAPTPEAAPQEPIKEPETYLGDGVYARFDGYSMWLDLRGQDNTTRICLDPGIFDKLIQFRNEAAAKYTRGD